MIIKKPEALRKEYTKGGNKEIMHYCPGCGHGNVHNYIAGIIDKLNIREKTILISPVGCSVFAYWYFNTDNIQAAHGRAPAVATGARRTNPDSIIISYQGDGDLAAIGTAEIIHAANRGENITVLFVNNAIYGMTGGQLAPTTLPGQWSGTSPEGRDVRHEGYPIKMCELLSSLNAPVFIARCSLDSAKEEAKTQKTIEKAIQAQVDGLGFSLIEIISPCPTQWKTDLKGAREYMQKMKEFFPLGVYRDEIEERRKEAIPPLKASKIEKLLTPPAVPEGVKKSTPKYDLPKKMLVAGFGGQGVMFLANLLGIAAHAEGRNIGSLPSYGPEQRSGTANKSVIISDDPIGSPHVSNPEIFIALSPAALDKFESKMVEGGLIVYNSSVIERELVRKDIKGVKVPASDIAKEMGNILSANMVMLGALLEETGIVSQETIEALLKTRMNKKGLADTNLKAIAEGRKWVREH